jgi:hypothetical protein
MTHGPLVRVVIRLSQKSLPAVIWGKKTFIPMKNSILVGLSWLFLRRISTRTRGHEASVLYLPAHPDELHQPVLLTTMHIRACDSYLFGLVAHVWLEA